MDKIRVGVIGIDRGTSMIRYCESAQNAKVVAICDKWKEGLQRKKEEINDPNVTYYTDYDEFLKHDMDAVVLANYAIEHAPFAIKAMNAGKNVLSEVLPCQTMKEAVELIETVERTGKQYCYLENYCYLPAPREMKRMYEKGLIGEIEYAEGEYIHNCETIWTSITQGNPDHWRNNMYANYYCTHSIGPMLHICGKRPVKVTGFELPYNDRASRMGRKGALVGVEMITLENGAVLKSTHGGLDRNSIWYTVYGSKGRLESARESVQNGGVERIYTEYYDTEGEYDKLNSESYLPAERDDPEDVSKGFGHGGSDYFSMYNCIEKLRGNNSADIIDVYEALSMSLCGMFAYRSVLNGGVPTEIPNLRNAEERDKWRNDTTCTDPKVAGDMLIPAYSKGNVNIPEEVYKMKQKEWHENSFSGAYWKK